MKNHNSAALFSYWDSLRDGDLAPFRTQIEPIDIKKLLADTFILEENGEREASFRLAGTNLCSLYGKELKGMSFADLWQDKDKRLINQIATSTLQYHSLIVLEFEALSLHHKTAAMELLLLPLREEGDGARALGSISHLEHPYWIGADPIISNRSRMVRVIDPAREHDFLNSRPKHRVTQFHTSNSQLETMPRRQARPSRGAHLSVIQGGRQD